MAQSVVNTSTPNVTTTSGAKTMAITLSAGTYRKAILAIMSEQGSGTFTPSSVTFDGVAMTQRVTRSVATPGQVGWMYEYDIPDVKGAGSYNFGYTIGNASETTAYGWQTAGSATGAPEATDSGVVAAGVNATVSCAGMTVTAGSLSVAGVLAQNADATWSSFGGGIAERAESNEGGYTSAVADGIQSSGGTVTLTGTASNNTGAKVIVAMSIAAAAVGPTIDTQPTAATVRINGDTTTSATFTVAATTSGGSLTYDWELETSVGGGSYSNLADGSGATWTGQTSASCVGTFTAKTLSGRRVRCNVTDDNGTTTTDAVVLTVLDGPVLSAASATTNGSGVASVTMTSDDALTADGEILLVTASINGEVIARTTVRPA